MAKKKRRPKRVQPGRVIAEFQQAVNTRPPRAAVPELEQTTWSLAGPYWAPGDAWLRDEETVAARWWHELSGYERWCDEVAKDRRYRVKAVALRALIGGVRASLWHQRYADARAPMAELRDRIQALVLKVAVAAQNYEGKPRGARTPLTRWLRAYRRARPEARPDDDTRQRLADDPNITCAERFNRTTGLTDYVLQWVGGSDDLDAVGAEVLWSSIVKNWARYAP